MKQKDLEALLKYWQDRLGLSHWDITIKFCSYIELEEAEGSCSPSPKRLLADIKVLDPKEYHKTDDDRPQDIEDTVVHELLHCLFPELEDNVQIEQAIVRLSRALLREHRGEEEFIK